MWITLNIKENGMTYDAKVNMVNVEIVKPMGNMGCLLCMRSGASVNITNLQPDVDKKIAQASNPTTVEAPVSDTNIDELAETAIKNYLKVPNGALKNTLRALIAEAIEAEKPKNEGNVDVSVPTGDIPLRKKNVVTSAALG